MLTKAKKEEQVETLVKIIQEYPTVVFTDFSGLSTSDLNELRGSLREQSISYMATKKSLWPFVHKKASIKEKDLTFENYKGSVGIAYSEGEGTETSKVIVKFAKEHERFSILGALVSGVYVNIDYIKELAALPSREELLAKLVYVMSGPIRNFVSVLKAPQRDFVSVLGQIQKGK